jgi:hypothetical protein
MKFSFKVFTNGSETLLAISDYSVLGRNLEDGDLCLFVSEDFYCDKFCDENEAKKLLNSATIVNAVGNDIVNIMVNEGLVKNNCVLNILGVSHAQIVTV